MDNTTFPKVLLLGNGINRAFGMASWENLLDSISQGKVLDLDNVPYPLRAVILTNDNVGNNMKEIAPMLAKMRASTEEEQLLRSIVLPFDVVLTSNYTYELEKALCPEFKICINSPCKFRKFARIDTTTFARNALHTYFEFSNMDKSIWHIHGEAAKPDTMVLGHYYYGKLLAEMQKYISVLIKRYKTCKTTGNAFEYRSWMDYFLIGDVTIVGFGLDLSEIDLWWLINAKKRHFPETHITFYKPDIKESEKLLAEAYGIKVVSDKFEDSFTDYYYKLASKMLSPQ